VVEGGWITTTTETQRTQRLHREEESGLKLELQPAILFFEQSSG